MQAVSICDDRQRTIRGHGAPILLVVGENDAIVDSGTRFQYEIEWACGVLPALRLLQDGLQPDLILLDERQQDMDCLEAISRLRALDRDLRIILISDAANPQVIARAFRLGVEDIFPKPIDLATCEARLESYFAGWRPSPHSIEPGYAAEELDNGTFFVAASESMRLIRAQAELVAKADFPVLCLGENGTEKEIIARLLHRLSHRANGPFLKIDCASIPADLLEDELFGCEQGSAGEQRLRPGKLELCNGGTVLLDEIEAIPLPLQARLLDVLEEREHARAGSSAKVRLNARIVAAAGVDVELKLAAKTFREDLYRRLSAFVFRLPALRERREDIPVLMRFYMKILGIRYALPSRSIPPELMKRCLEYAWPGNIQELENFVKQYLVLGIESFDGCLTKSHPAVRENAVVGGPAEGAGELRQSLKQAEASAITAALDRTQWNRRAAAVLLRISYKTLLHKIRLYEIDGRPNQGMSTVKAPETVIRTCSDFMLPPDHLVLGSASSMEEVRRSFAAAAGSDRPVLIRGASGTGKEVLAKLIHQASSRGAGPLVRVNCPGMADSLLQSGMSTCERGASSSANASRLELAGMARGGTLFFDEQAEPDTEVLAKLLQSPQDRLVSRPNELEEFGPDVRIICSVRRASSQSPNSKAFENGSYTRGDVIAVEMPPLRERQADILPLAEYFVRLYEQRLAQRVPPFSNWIRKLLFHYEWPGNIRQLEEVIRRFVVRGDEESIARDLLRGDQPAGIAEDAAGETLSLKQRMRTATQELERTLILESLYVHDWNRREVARHLKISSRALYLKLKQAGVTPRRGLSPKTSKATHAPLEVGQKTNAPTKC